MNIYAAGRRPGTLDIQEPGYRKEQTRQGDLVSETLQGEIIGENKINTTYHWFNIKQGSSRIGEPAPRFDQPTKILEGGDG